MRFVYILIAYLIAPLWIGALAIRGFRDKTHWRGFSQRFGLGATVQGRSIWVHAVSVGEVQAAVPLVEALLTRFPQIPLVLTTVTPTGRARAEAIFKQRVDVRYVPIDWPGSVSRFFQRVQPQLAVILETEIWPNLYHRCGRMGVPLVLASARISPRSVNRYRRPSASAPSAPARSARMWWATSSSILAIHPTWKPAGTSCGKCWVRTGRSGWLAVRMKRKKSC
jgi:3-deoxy-D-manno-octulosonic-acid transferase